MCLSNKIWVRAGINEKSCLESYQMQSEFDTVKVITGWKIYFGCSVWWKCEASSVFAALNVGQSIAFFFCVDTAKWSKTDRGRERERKSRVVKGGREKGCLSIQRAGGGLLQPVSFWWGGITFLWGGMEMDWCGKRNNKKGRLVQTGNKESWMLWPERESKKEKVDNDDLSHLLRDSVALGFFYL